MDNPTDVLEDNEEENLDKELAGYGFQEQGLSLDEKRNLFHVLKDSEATAREEEHSRVGLKLEDESIGSPSNQSDSEPKHNVNYAEESEVTELECFPRKEVSFQASSNPSRVLDSESNYDGLDIVESPKTDELNHSSVKFTPKVSRLSLKSRIDATRNDRPTANLDLLTDVNTAHCPSPPLSQNRYEITNKADLCTTEESVPLKNELKLMPHKKEDRKRNIDVFNVIKDGSERPLVRIEKANVVGKTPFYVVPHGMNLKDFTVYFNKQLAKIATSLMLTQTQSLDFVPWGNPVVVSKSDNNKSMFEETTGPIDSNTSTRATTPMFQNQRYNFRGRSNKRKNQDDIFSYKDSDEENSDDNMLFSSKVSKDNKMETSRPLYSGITKRKSVFSALGDALGEHEVDLYPDKSTSNTAGPSSNNGTTTIEHDLSSDDEIVGIGVSGNARVKNICKSGIVRKMETDERRSQDAWMPLNIVNDDEEHSDDDDFEDSLENNIRKKKTKPNSKLQFANKKNKVSKPNLVQRTGAQEEGNNRGVRGGSKRLAPGWITTMNLSQEDPKVIKPMPVVNAKVRKLFKPNSTTSKANKKPNKLSSQEIDEVISPAESDNEGNEEPLQAKAASDSQCPICRNLFNKNDIVNHAADCNVVFDDADDVPETQSVSTSRCPICIESFPTGHEFDLHTKSCHVSKRRVQPPSSSNPVRNRSKR